MSSTTEKTTAASRTRWQYSLRTLLIVMVVVGFGAGYLGLRMRRARQQEQIVEKILAIHGTVLYHYQLNDQGKFDARLKPTAPLWLRRSLGSHFFDRPASVTISGYHITDADLLPLEKLPSLENIYLIDTDEVTQRGYDRLQQAFSKATIIVIQG